LQAGNPALNCWATGVRLGHLGRKPVAGERNPYPTLRWVNMPALISSDPRVREAGEALNRWRYRDLAEWLQEGRLEVWTKPDENLRPLGDYFADWYPITMVRLFLPEGTHNSAVDFGDLIQGAFQETLAPSAVLEMEAIPDELQEPAMPKPAASEWNGLAFRSKSELRIAQALERMDVAFFPNAAGRLGVTRDHRETRVPDFLVIHRRKVGILEVDGRPWHPSAAADHERDRLFREHGIRVVERFDAGECYESPGRVVAHFLMLLSLNG
jgi:hypothetical protein